MKPEQWWLDLYQDLLAYAPFNTDLARAFVAVDMDAVPEEDEKGYRRAEGWSLTFEGVVRKEWTNFVQALHGGAAAFLVDVCTSGAMIAISSPTFWAPPMLSGVSIDLNVQYYHPVKMGTRLQLKCTILRCTTTLANIRCDAINVDTGQVMFTGTHLKSWKAGKQDGPTLPLPSGAKL